MWMLNCLTFELSGREYMLPGVMASQLLPCFCSLLLVHALFIFVGPFFVFLFCLSWVPFPDGPDCNATKPIARNLAGLPFNANSPTAQISANGLIGPEWSATGQLTQNSPHTNGPMAQNSAPTPCVEFLRKRPDCPEFNANGPVAPAFGANGPMAWNSAQMARWPGIQRKRRDGRKFSANNPMARNLVQTANSPMFSNSTQTARWPQHSAQKSNGPEFSTNGLMALISRWFRNSGQTAQWPIIQHNQ